MFSFFPLQTFSITDPDVQRREIDSVCLFFVMVGVVSFFTQMLQVGGTRMTAPPAGVQGYGEGGKSRGTSFLLPNEYIVRMKKIPSHVLLRRCPVIESWEG